MTALFDIEPGGGDGLATVREEAAKLWTATVVGGMPAELLGSINTEKVKSQAIAVMKEAAKGGILSAVSIAFAAFDAIIGAAQAYARKLAEETAAGLAKGLDDVAEALIDEANGNIFCLYQMAEEISGEPPGNKRCYTAPLRDRDDVRSAWNKGVVAVIPRAGKSAIATATLPNVTCASDRYGFKLAPNVYGIAGEELPVASNRWVDEKPQFIGNSYIGKSLPNKWLLVLDETMGRDPKPPMFCKRLFAPGLAPWIGPSGEAAPVSGRLLAYSASLLEVAPPDLDVAIKTWRDSEVAPLLDPSLRELLKLMAHTREDRRRRRGEAPDPNWDPFPESLNPDPPPKGGNGGGFGGVYKGGKLGEEDQGGSGGLWLALGGLSLVGAGAGALLYRRHRAMQRHTSRKGRR